SRAPRNSGTRGRGSGNAAAGRDAPRADRRRAAVGGGEDIRPALRSLLRAVEARAGEARVLALALGRLLRAQLLQARVEHRKLIEVAVARAAGELKLLDRRRQASLQRVVLALRLVLQQ